LLAIVYFAKQYRMYLLGRPFVIRTDPSALQWLRKTPEPIGQQSRWLEQLEEYDFELVHRAGKQHTNADALSRIPCRQCKGLHGAYGWELQQPSELGPTAFNAADPVGDAEADGKEVGMTAAVMQTEGELIPCDSGSS